MIHSYVFEKISLAVRWLAIAEGSIQDRVRDAYLFHLAHVSEKDLPDEPRGVLKEIKQKLTKVSPIYGKEESIKASTSAMSADQASFIADKIVYLFNQVAEKYYQESSRV